MSGLFESGKDKQLKLAFWKIREELNEHLETINQNTNEIQEAFEVLVRIEQKLDRIESRIERMEIEKEAHSKLIHLAPREEEVFAVLYTSEERLTLRQISSKLSLPEEIVNTITYNLLAKGIPVLKQMTPDSVLIYLDRAFKDSHAKNPVVKVSEKILNSVVEEKI